MSLRPIIVTPEQFRAFMTAMPEMWKEVLRSASIRVASECDDLMPGPRTGRLQSSMRVNIVGDSLEIEWLSGIAPYAAFVEEGVPAHEILPVNKEVLKFRVGFQDIYAKHVHHPGFAAKPFSMRVGERAMQIISEEVSNVFSQFGYGSVRKG